MTQHRDPGGWPFSSLPGATNRRLPCISSLLCPPSAGAQDKLLQTKGFCVGPVRWLSASLAVSSWWTETLLLFTVRCYLGSFPSSGVLWCSLDPTLLRGNPLATEISLGTSAATCGSPVSPLLPLLHFLCLVVLSVGSVSVGYRFLSN